MNKRVQCAIASCRDRRQPQVTERPPAPLAVNIYCRLSSSPLADFRISVYHLYSGVLRWAATHKYKDGNQRQLKSRTLEARPSVNPAPLTVEHRGNTAAVGSLPLSVGRL